MPVVVIVVVIESLAEMNNGRRLISNRPCSFLF